MSAPFYPQGAFSDEVSLALALMIGVGFFLERAGFGSARKLVSQFYLDDLAVFKVMLTAIVTAMLGLWLLSGVGFLDLSLVSLVPTYWIAQVVGGLVLGVGFAAGTLGFALVFPHVQGLYTAGELGPTTLPDVLGIPHAVVVLGVVLIALAGFRGASSVERSFRQAGTSRTEKYGD
jgi:hypothetical protein